MPLFITSLNSGSNGNCYYIGNEREAVLIDAGISCRETEKRMSRLGLSMQKVKAIFVSHEHSDHISGIPVLAKKYRLPVFITPKTRANIRHNWDDIKVINLIGFETVALGQLRITGFPKWHDAVDPHSFMVSCQNINVGVFTDIGSPCNQVVQHFEQCHAAFLEANYDDDLLQNGYYPYHLKKRIRGDKGHLSNRQALALFCDYKPAFMTHVVLAHLSKNNNCPVLVKDLFSAHTKGTEIIVASRTEETALFRIDSRPGLVPENLNLGKNGQLQLWPTIAI